MTKSSWKWREIFKDLFTFNEGVFSGDGGLQEDDDFEDVSGDGESV